MLENPDILILPSLHKYGKKAVMLAKWQPRAIAVLLNAKFQRSHGEIRLPSNITLEDVNALNPKLHQALREDLAEMVTYYHPMAIEDAHNLQPSDVAYIFRVDEISAFYDERLRDMVGQDILLRCTSPNPRNPGGRKFTGATGSGHSHEETGQLLADMDPAQRLAEAIEAELARDMNRIPVRFGDYTDGDDIKIGHKIRQIGSQGKPFILLPSQVPSLKLRFPKMEDFVAGDVIRYATLD